MLTSVFSICSFYREAQTQAEKLLCPLSQKSHKIDQIEDVAGEAQQISY
jgi:hypothetical protein